MYSLLYYNLLACRYRLWIEFNGVETMAMQMQIEPVARYEMHQLSIEKLNAMIQQKRRGKLPDEPQVELCLDSLLLEAECLFYMREVQWHRRNNEVWFSEPFYSGPQGYKMRLGVYANGDTEVRGSYESVFLQLLKGEFDDRLSWPFKGNVTVKLLDQSSTRFPQHIQTTIAFTFWKEGEDRAVSVPKFARLVNGIRYCPYEINDCSWYEVNVQPTIF